MLGWQPHIICINCNVLLPHVPFLKNLEVPSQKDYWKSCERNDNFAYNALLYGTSGENQVKLQRLQNVTAKIIVGGSKYEHVTTILRELHWLPVESRIHFKIMVLVHTGPVYLQENVNMYKSGRSLRSQSDRLLTRPRTRSRAGDATFVSAAADMWNTLPLDLRLIEDICSFWPALKAHYFTKYYGGWCRDRTIPPPLKSQKSGCYYVQRLD